MLQHKYEALTLLTDILSEKDRKEIVPENIYFRDWKHAFWMKWSMSALEQSFTKHHKQIVQILKI